MAIEIGAGCSPPPPMHPRYSSIVPNLDCFQEVQPSGGIAATTSAIYYRRDMLTLPIGIAIEYLRPSDAESIPEKPPGTSLAFMGAEKLLKFMKSNPGGEWKMRIAD